ncbi:hypothetical protein ACLOJK_022283 [Asimina triloba]
MEVRSESLGSKCDRLSSPMLLRRSRLQLWLIRVCSCILLWTCLIQLVAVGELWHPRLPKYWHSRLGFGDSSAQQLTKTASFSLPSPHAAVPPPPPPPSISISSLPLLYYIPWVWSDPSNATPRPRLDNHYS